MPVVLQQKLIALIYIQSRVESGSDDPENLGHFLVGQMVLIRKLNHLDVTWISLPCSLESSVVIWYVSELWF